MSVPPPRPSRDGSSDPLSRGPQFSSDQDDAPGAAAVGRARTDDGVAAEAELSAEFTTGFPRHRVESDRSEKVEAPAPPSRDLIADAQAWARLGGRQATELVGREDTAGAAAALLEIHLPPASEMPVALQAERAERCAAGASDRAGPDARASWLLSTAAFLGLVVLAGWLILRAGSRLLDRWGPVMHDDSLAPSPLFPESWHVDLLDQILLLGPLAILALYPVFHLAVLWRATAHGRSVLAWAGEEGRWDRLGIPVHSPFRGLAGSWDLLSSVAIWLGFCQVGSALVPVVLGGDTWADAPWAATLLCLVPTVVVGVIATRRTTVMQRRDDLLQELLHRHPESAARELRAGSA